ncbi:MAG: SCP2 sterol-binding domain-containing protein [Deltaproteobacteria bacterium]|nr:SCP2 sterol-binding domain-containing protein [Deltaproteobacteria bacterium]
MSDHDIAAIEGYLRQQLAPRFGQIASAAAQRADPLLGEAHDLRAARGSIAWQVTGAGTWYLNIAEGAMVVDSCPLEAPFMHVAQSLADWQLFAGGAASTGFMGAGASRRALGKARIERLRNLSGTVRFVVTGLGGGGAWSFVTHFGAAPMPPEPQTTVTVDALTMQRLQSGEVSPQLAFMQGKIRITGDVAVAIQLGTVLLM